MLVFPTMDTEISYCIKEKKKYINRVPLVSKAGAIKQSHNTISWESFHKSWSQSELQQGGYRYEYSARRRIV